MLLYPTVHNYKGSEGSANNQSCRSRYAVTKGKSEVYTVGDEKYKFDQVANGAAVFRKESRCGALRPRHERVAGELAVCRDTAGVHFWSPDDGVVRGSFLWHGAHMYLIVHIYSAIAGCLVGGIPAVHGTFRHFDGMTSLAVYGVWNHIFNVRICPPLNPFLCQQQGFSQVEKMLHI